MYVCMCIYIYIYTYIHTYVYINIYIRYIYIRGGRGGLRGAYVCAEVCNKLSDIISFLIGGRTSPSIQFSAGLPRMVFLLIMLIGYSLVPGQDSCRREACSPWGHDRYRDAVGWHRPGRYPLAPLGQADVGAHRRGAPSFER